MKNLLDMSLSKKIAGSILAVFLPSIVLLFLVLNWLYSSTFNATLSDIQQFVLEEKRQAAHDILREVRFATESSLQRGEFTQFVRFAERQKELAEIEEFSFYGKTGKIELSSNSEVVGNELDPELWKRIRESEEVVVVEDERLLSFYEPLRVDVDMRRLNPEWEVGDVYGLLHLEFSKGKIQQMLVSAEEKRQAAAARTFAIAMGFTALAALAVFVVAMAVSRWIAGSLGMLVAVFKKAQDEGDLTQRLDVRSNDELGQLASSLNAFLETLQGIVRDIAGKALTLAQSSTALSTTATDLTSGADETTRQSAVVSSAADQMSNGMESIASQTQQMNVNVKTVASAVEEMTASAGEIAKNAEHASGVVAGAARLAESSNQTVSRLGSAADEIGKVIETIQDIAEQTNLLALNATIEAARAGSAGKGFAVVASEVKELAKQTSEATEDIRTRVEGIQDSTGEAVRSIGEISDVIKQVDKVSHKIATAIEEQSTSTREIAEHVTHTSEAAATVTQGVGHSAATSEEINQSIVGVDQAAKQTARGATEARTAGENLSQMADELQALVGQFQV